MVPSGMRTVARVGRVRRTGAEMSPMVAWGMWADVGFEVVAVDVDSPPGMAARGVMRSRCGRVSVGLVGGEEGEEGGHGLWLSVERSAGKRNLRARRRGG